MNSFYEELFGYDVTEIYPNLYMGSEPCAEESMYKDFDVIVYCAQGIKPPIDKFKDKCLMFVPLEDIDFLPQERLNQAEQIAIWAAKDILDGKKVLVTCAAGINRSGLVTAFILRLLTGWNGFKCVKEIKGKRAFALTNKTFVDYISCLLSITPITK